MMNNRGSAKNELLQFLGGLAMLAVGLFLLSERVTVSTFPGRIYMFGQNMNTGIVIIPFIIGVVWMFGSNGSLVSKIYTAISVLFIIAMLIMNTNFYMVRISLFEWILMLVLIFGGGTMVARILFTDNKKGKDEKMDKYKKKYGLDDEE